MTDGAFRRGVLSSDTSWDVERRQVEVWRRMSHLERARLVDSASRAIRVLALAGIRSRYPQASEAEAVARYAELTLGSELARRVYPHLLASACRTPGT